MTIDWRYTDERDLGILSVAGYLGPHAVHRFAGAGRPLELAAIPADGSLVPTGNCPDIPVHPDLATALSAHNRRLSSPEDDRRA
ncbi:hypothetical protein [Streptomyces sp. Tu102]|uniref:hypothetical protein n=1 Tax=Streptomyces sp. Tu102 TaxID=2838019 RepID=UPI001BDC9421|nr:hypothetical protein [Streptomyces sp. Tu102]MBT1093279.1 hypothetical protein [Streptomyces sp. Tu102]